MKIGVLGGGQLARMLALAGHPLGIEIVCIDPQPDCAAKAVTQVITADFADLPTIQRAWQGVEVVTYETENLPFAQVAAIAQHYPLSPSLEALKIAQDRLYEKDFFTQLAIPTTPYMAINSWEELQAASKQLAYPLVLKTRRSGYDGKGQYVIKTPEAAQRAWQQLGSYPLIAEKFVSYQFELSQIAVRSKTGEVRFYPLALNQHHEGILVLSTAPYANAQLAATAQIYMRAILEKFAYVGTMAIEFFCVNGQLIVNEMAPRVHNSGHWTIEGAETSQFENHLRAVLGLPLGDTAARGFSAMINYIGEEPHDLNELLKIKGLHLHRYGKVAAPKRKLGHITLCADNSAILNSNVEQVLQAIRHSLS